MKILVMILPRLELLARLAADQEVTRDGARLAELREAYRYLAAVCRNILPDLEDDLQDLPAPFPVQAAADVRVAYQMALSRRTQRLYRAVEAAVARHQRPRGQVAAQ